MTIENGWTKRIAELEDSNRRLSAALKRGPTDHMRAEMDLAPVFDARGELTTLIGILGAVIYLTAPDAEEPEKEDLLTAMVAVQEKLSELADGLNGAIGGMKIVKEVTS